MSFLFDVFAGSASGALEGVGKLAVSLREAITGDIPAGERAKLESVALQIESAAHLAHNKVNEIEARHSSLFVSGWRPGVGWVCVLGLGYQLRKAKQSQPRYRDCTSDQEEWQRYLDNKPRVIC